MTIYCDTCIHSGLCKHEESYRKGFDIISDYKIFEDDTLPFSLALTCSKFEDVSKYSIPQISTTLPFTQPSIAPFIPTHPNDINTPVYQPILTCSTKEKE